jgi:hypothetical protein
VPPSSGALGTGNRLFFIIFSAWCIAAANFRQPGSERKAGRSAFSRRRRADSGGKRSPRPLDERGCARGRTRQALADGMAQRCRTAPQARVLRARPASASVSGWPGWRMKPSRAEVCRTFWRRQPTAPRGPVLHQRWLRLAAPCRQLVGFGACGVADPCAAPPSGGLNTGGIDRGVARSPARATWIDPQEWQAIAGVTGRFNGHAAQVAGWMASGCPWRASRAASGKSIWICFRRAARRRNRIEGRTRPNSCACCRGAAIQS